MNLKVLKFGGSTLTGKDAMREIARLIKYHKGNKVIVSSALTGVTDKLENFLKRPIFNGRPSGRYFKNGRHYGKIPMDIGTDRANRAGISELINYLKERHQGVMEVCTGCSMQDIYQTLKDDLDKLERLLYGIFYTEELTEKTRDLILSFGERFSVKILEGILRAEGVTCRSFEADKIGIVTDGDFGDASALLNITSGNLKKRLYPLLRQGITPIITGFFGADEYGHTTIFGRGGSDYSAAVIAYALSAKELILYKDVDGFMSTDPNIIPDAHLLKVISYDEAAELAYFGAKILHPKTIEPLKLKDIPMTIRNIRHPDKEGTKIQSFSYQSKDVVKSVAYGSNIAVIKVHGAGIGYKPGVLQDIVSHITNQNINIKSVITSQTCINILLDKNDLEASFRALSRVSLKTVDKIEPINDIVLIGIVGEGLLQKRGLAARVFKAVSEIGVNVEMISAGHSSVAYYFIVKEPHLKKTIRAIHYEFFKV
ncbi:MAG: aspartate kinase [Planctomycetota bacterium]